MSELQELYQQLIIDHGRHPRNFSKLACANHSKEGYNPLCGDRLTVYVWEEAGLIKDMSFTGSGCAISMASASLMTGALKGKNLSEVKKLFDGFHALMTGGKEVPENNLGKLIALAGVAEYPMRVKCATLSWHTLMAAMDDSDELVSTE